MTVPIIIEGPDESGKTTLALALYGYLQPNTWFLKSPAGKSPEWSSYFDSWVSKVTSDCTEPYLILDRVPEISEVVYGPIMRGQSRLNNPVGSILSLPKDAVVIFCHPRPGPLAGKHYAGGAKLLRPEDQGAIIGGYQVVEAIVRECGPTLSWFYWRSDELWRSLLDWLAIEDHSPSLTFQEGLERGTEMVRDLPREAF